MAVKMKYAAQKKAKIVSISNGKTKMEEYADVSFKLDNNMEFLKSFIKALFDGGYVKEAEVVNKAENIENLLNFVKNSKSCDDAIKLAKIMEKLKRL